jgi:hypothetical protein
MEYRLRVTEFPCTLPHPFYPGSGFFYKPNPVIEICDDWVSSDAFMAEISLLHAGRKSSRTADFNPIREDLNKYVCSFDKPVTVHDCIVYGFPEREPSDIRDSLLS